MISQQLNTFGTLLLSKWVNTNDKLIDNTLIGIFSVVFAGLMTHIAANWAQYYNMCIFYLYRMGTDPLNMRKVPYKMDIHEYLNYDEFSLKNPKIGLISVELGERVVEKACIDYIEKRNIGPLRSKGGEPIIRWPAGKIYPIAVSSSGNIVFYDGDCIKLVSKTYKDVDCIIPYFEREIKNIISSTKKISVNNGIYYPMVGEEGRIISKSLGLISAKKTFDTLFYPQKTELINLLTRFQKGELYPAHIPMDNKLGILLYGPPGTGKTGTISAIANMLGRSLLIINFTEITTTKQLDELMNPHDYKDYVIVFDEFDCVLDVISGSQKQKEEKPEWGNMLLFAEGEERKNLIKMMKEGRSRKADTPIDMAYLLQKLDGLESAEGRIIVATTNNPDKINPALLRPGRFDLKLCLGLCTQSMIVDILVNFYRGDEKMRSRIAGAQIPGGRYSPLELINMAIQQPNVEKLLKRLRAA